MRTSGAAAHTTRHPCRTAVPTTLQARCLPRMLFFCRLAPRSLLSLSIVILALQARATSSLEVFHEDHDKQHSSPSVPSGTRLGICLLRHSPSLVSSSDTSHAR